MAKSRQLVDRWAQRHSWHDRAEAFDKRIDDVKTEVIIDAARTDAQEMVDRHRQQAKLIQQRALERLRDARDVKLSSIDAIRALEIAQRLERITAGQSTENVALNVSGARDEHFRFALDPESADLANALIGRLGGRTPVTAGSALDSEQRAVG
ncbi:MAG: hypothetical protein M3Y09_18620 [Actinomycetota bacterium]|nr:hypothetical protein [Actinomycetota bacterium]